MSNLLYQNADKASFFNKLTEVAVVFNPGYYIRITLEAFFKNASIFRPHPRAVNSVSVQSRPGHEYF